jgi:hypothetical protein
MEFYRAVGQVEAGPDLQHVIATWWGQAMLGHRPGPGPNHRGCPERHHGDRYHGRGHPAPTHSRGKKAELSTAKVQRCPTARKIAITAGISTRVSASHIGRESHIHVGPIPAASRDVRAHAAHSGSGLYRDSTVTRQARQIRSPASV